MATAGNEAKIKELREAAQKLLAADYFVALGVSRTASPDDVKRAFIEIVKAWHPDRVPQGLEELRPLYSKVFARLELARATVSDPQRRAKYIEDLAKPSNASSSDISAAEATLEFRKAEAMLKKNDAAQAEKHLKRAIELAPSKVEFQALLVSIHAKDDTPIVRLRELVAELTVLVTRDPTCEKAYFYRAQLRKRLDLTKEAQADFAKAADLNPKNVDAVREVRLHNMRKERAAPGGGAKSDGAKSDGAKPDDGEGGPLGFFKRLFKR